MTVALDTEEARLDVEDDGAGMPTTTHAPSGVGLLGMRERGHDLPELLEFVAASQRRDHGFLQRVSDSVGEYVLANAEKYPELSALLSLTALAECVATPTARRALMAALTFNHGRLLLSGHSDTVRALAWSPDGTRIATASYAVRSAPGTRTAVPRST